MILPAVLISAAALLILGANARYGRIIDRVRLLNRAILEGTASDLEAHRAELALFSLRAKRAWLAIALLHSSVLVFVLESLLLGLFAAFRWPALRLLQNGAIVLGILLLGGSSLSLVLEARVAYEAMRREIGRTEKRTPST